MSQRWNGAVAVVTGASSGIGMQLCTDLRARGAQVVGVARRIQGGTTVSCDVADTDAFRALLADVEAEHGRIDLLVNCAAVEERSWARDGDLDVHHRIMAVNYFAPVAGTLAVLPGMIRRRRGVVVNVSSDSARAPAPGTAAYAASKAALSAFSEAVAHEVRPFGVRVHVFYPGWVPTPMGTRAVEMGMPMPPRFVRRSPGQVSRLLLARAGGEAVEISAVRVAALTGLARAFLPRLYNRSVVCRGAGELVGVR